MTGRSRVSILLVDDNAAKRLALKAVLLPLGHSIVEAESGRAALRCVLEQEFAVILLDVRMPIMDGFETAALIRQRRQSEFTPIIFITAYTSNEMRSTDRYVEGAVDFIFAPVQPDELRAKVTVFANLFVKAERLASKALEAQTSADQLRMITESAPIGIFQTDTENRYVYTNPRWTEITGIPPEEVLGRLWDSIIGSEQRAALTSRLAGNASELSHQFEIRIPGERPRIVLATSRYLPVTDGGAAGWVGTLADITAEAHAESAMSDARDKATEASHLKSDFLANMSHEIRTPMNGVLGMTDLLLETDLDAQQRDYAQTVRNSGEALLTIINDILDFSKVEAGKLEIENIEFDLRTIVDDTVDLLARPAQARGLELIAVIDNSVPAAVTGDPGRVRQVLTNIIGNAIKFTHTGEIVVRVAEAEVVGADTVVRFDVSDTGDGIAPDKIDVIFRPFVQADTSTSRKYGGTGLGLAICGQLVALMGGNCGVSSRLAAGSNFWFTIRVRAGDGRSTHLLPLSDADLTGVTALVVDDNATQRSVLSEFLTDWGMTVGTADSGDSALALLHAAVARGRPISVAMVDQGMPGMDGGELRNAVAGDPALAATEVVLLTGLAQVGGAERAPAACPSVSKPVHREDLRACLRTVLGPPPPPPAPAAEAAADEPSDSRPQLGRLLLAEDNLINQKVAVAILTSRGYLVDTVLDGAAAVRAATSKFYDAILMDCQMPELDGYQATAAIRAHEGSGRRTPIIALTAGARQEDRDRCLAEGMDSHLAKPVNKDALLASIHRWDAVERMCPLKGSTKGCGRG